MLEFFGGGLHGGTSGPDVVEEEVGRFAIDGVFWVDGVGGAGLSEAGRFSGTDLDGIGGAN